LGLTLGRLFELVSQKAHHLVETIIPLHFGGDGLAGVEDGPVIATSERFSDLLEAFSCHLSAQIHGHHAWKSDMRGTPLAGHIRDAKVVTFGNTALDQLVRTAWVPVISNSLDSTS
jgi:hypothetical protein